jgi:hypothetical protein
MRPGASRPMCRRRPFPRARAGSSRPGHRCCRGGRRRSGRDGGPAWTSRCRPARRCACCGGGAGRVPRGCGRPPLVVRQRGEAGRRADSLVTFRSVKTLFSILIPRFSSGLPWRQPSCAQLPEVPARDLRRVQSEPGVPAVVAEVADTRVLVGERRLRADESAAAAPLRAVSPTTSALPVSSTPRNRRRSMPPSSPSTPTRGSRSRSLQRWLHVVELSHRAVPSQTNQSAPLCGCPPGPVVATRGRAGCAEGPPAPRRSWRSRFPCVGRACFLPLSCESLILLHDMLLLFWREATFHRRQDRGKQDL